MKRSARSNTHKPHVHFCVHTHTPVPPHYPSDAISAMKRFISSSADDRAFFTGGWPLG